MRRLRTLTSTIAAAALLFSAANAAAIDITIKNTSSRAVDGVYLSATTQSAWGPDLLDGGIVAPGDAWTVGGMSCVGTFVLIAEDVGGCFLYQSVSCATDASWTITNSTPRDCGR